jgi:hypothetical protein
MISIPPVRLPINAPSGKADTELITSFVFTVEKTIIPFAALMSIGALSFCRVYRQRSEDNGKVSCEYNRRMNIDIDAGGNADKMPEQSLPGCRGGASAAAYSG